MRAGRQENAPGRPGSVEGGAAPGRDQDPARRRRVPCPPPPHHGCRKTTARLTYESVRHDQEKDLHLVVTLSAPPLDSRRKRPPVCVVPVIDVSGSMAGDKLHFARQSVMKLVDHLGPGDFCGLVTFSTEVATVFEAQEVTQGRKDLMKAAVGRLEPTQTTNLAGGMLRGLELARGTLPPGMLARVILFTDEIGRAHV